MWHNHLSVILEDVRPKIIYFFIYRVGLLVYGGVIELGSLKVGAHE